MQRTIKGRQLEGRRLRRPQSPRLCSRCSTPSQPRAWLWATLSSSNKRRQRLPWRTSRSSPHAATTLRSQLAPTNSCNQLD